MTQTLLPSAAYLLRSSESADTGGSIFDAFRKLAHDQAGFAIRENKETLVSARIGIEMRQAGAHTLAPCPAKGAQQQTTGAGYGLTALMPYFLSLA
jgi:hypothetical protein